VVAHVDDSGAGRRSTVRLGFNGQVLLDPGFRGLTRYTTELLREFSTRPGIELHVFSRAIPVASHVTGIRATVHVMEGGRETVWLERDLPRELSRTGLELFHAPADSGLPWSRPCPLVVTVHDSYARRHWRCLLPRVKQRAAYWRDEWTNRFRAAAVLTPSDTTRAELIELGIAPAERIHRVYLAPAEVFGPEPRSEDSEVLARYDLMKPYVLYVGGYDERKNTHTLVGAFLDAELQGTSLVIAARKQWGFQSLVARFGNHRGFGAIRGIEAEPHEIPALYRHALFFANLSLWESFSFQVVEAMASGTPLLCSDRKALPEIAGSAAMFVNPEDRIAVVHSMQRLKREASLREELRGKGLERARAFSWRKTADETLAIYSRVLETHGSAE